MVTRDVLKGFQIVLTYDSCNYQNIANLDNIITITWTKMHFKET